MLEFEIVDVLCSLLEANITIYLSSCLINGIKCVGKNGNVYAKICFEWSENEMEENITNINLGHKCVLYDVCERKAVLVCQNGEKIGGGTIYCGEDVPILNFYQSQIQICELKEEIKDVKRSLQDMNDLLKHAMAFFELYSKP